MDDRTMNGILSERRMTALIENSPLLSEIRKELKGLKTDFDSKLNTVRGGGTDGVLQDEPDYEGTFQDQGTTWGLWHHHGKLRRCPEDWTFPNSCSLAICYDLWHCGDEVKKICPLKLFKPADVDFVPRGRKNLDDMRFVCTKIDSEAKRLNLYKTKMSRQEVRKCLLRSKQALGVSSTTKTGRKRRLESLSWSTFLREMPTNLRKRHRYETTTSGVTGGVQLQLTATFRPRTNETNTTTTNGNGTGAVGGTSGRTVPAQVAPPAAAASPAGSNQQNSAVSNSNNTNNTASAGDTNVNLTFEAAFAHVDGTAALNSQPRMSTHEISLLRQHNRQTTTVNPEGDHLYVGGQRVDTSREQPNASDPGFRNALDAHFTRR